MSVPDSLDIQDFDLTNLDLFSDGFPHEVFLQLRRNAPIWWHEPTQHTPDGVGFWVVSTHSRVLEIVSDAEAFSSDRAPGEPGGGTLIQDLPHGFAGGVLLNMMDDPRHREIRRLVTPTVSPRALAVLERELRSRTTKILDSVAESGSCDFLLDVAVELPLQATAILLGVPEEDRHDLMSWSNATLDHDDRELGETNSAMQFATASMAEYGTELIARKKATTGEHDILATLCRSTIEGVCGPEPLSDLELLMFFNLLIAAGTETTRNAIALGMAALVDNPDQLELLRRNRSLVPSAVEEILRWSSPTLYNRRTATRDIDVGGANIRKSDKVTLWWASANFDESAFDEPFRFDIKRSPNPHLAFGFKGHFCLGANLARLEVRILFEQILDRFSEFVVNGPIERFRTNKHAGIKHMPMVMTPCR